MVEISLPGMRIGIDISQIVFTGTGVSVYVRRMVTALITRDTKNSYVLFGASLRRRKAFSEFAASLPRKVELVVLPVPPTILDILWNRLHILPVEWFTGRLDIFWSSDWTQPPLFYARGVTTIHDLIVYTYPEETHGRTDISGGEVRANIVAVQKRRLRHVARECDAAFCDSESTKRDAMRLLGMEAKKLHVIYPGAI